MKKLKIFIVIILRKTGLLNWVNFNLSKKINGLKVRIPFMHGMGINNYLLEEDWLDSLIDQLLVSGNDVFVDVGVNIGQTTIRFKTLRPDMKYVGFEPNSNCAFYAQQLIKVNEFKNCVVHNIALSTANQILILEKRSLDDSRATVLPSFGFGLFKDKEYVTSTNYDSLYINQKISFVKIDVEFAELDVIIGMQQSILKYQPVIVCEVLDSDHPSEIEIIQSRATELSNLLKSLNYSIIKLETSRLKNKIIDFSKINTIKIVQWTHRSLDLNDYLFYPTKREQEVMSVLLKIKFQGNDL